MSLTANLSLTWIFHESMDLEPNTAFGAALGLVLFLNFGLSRFFVFRATQDHPIEQFSKFLLSVIGFRIGELAGFVLVRALLPVPYLLVAFAVLSSSFLLKFFFFRAKVFVPASWA